MDKSSLKFHIPKSIDEMDALRNQHGAHRASTTAGLQKLRRSVAWSGAPKSHTVAERDRTHVALSERLESLLVLELLKDGGRKYLMLSVRGLYKHVLGAITTIPQQQQPEDPPQSAVEAEEQIQEEIAAGGPSRKASPQVITTMNTVLSSPTPLGLVSTPADSSIDVDTKTFMVSDSFDAPPVDSDQVKVSFHKSTSKLSASDSYIKLPVPTSIPKPKRSRRTNSVSVFPPDITDEHVQNSPEVTYRERLGGYLHPRDMRRLVTPFSASNQPELIVRRHVMLLNFDPLRAIVLRDRLLVIVPDGADSMLVQLENRVRGGAREAEACFFGEGECDEDNDPDALQQTHKSNGGPHTSPRKAPLDRFRKILGKPLTSSGRVQAHHPPPSFTDSTTPMRRPTSAPELGHDVDGKGMSPQQENITDSAQLSAHTESESSIGDELESEWNELTAHAWVDLPFELQCADAVLHVVGMLLSEDTYEVQHASIDYIQGLLSNQGDMTDDPLTIIRAVKDAVREMSSRVKGFVASLTQVLDEDEDMALMNLSRLLSHPERFIQPVSQAVLEEESDEPELILEAHLQIAQTLTNSLDLVQGQIDTAAELVDQKLDAQRNRLLFANMVISILSLCVACGSLVGSIFGMNLKNRMEDEADKFNKIAFGTLAGTIGMAGFILFILRYSGTVPSFREQR